MSEPTPSPTPPAPPRCECGHEMTDERLNELRGLARGLWARELIAEIDRLRAVRPVEGEDADALRLRVTAQWVLDAYDRGTPRMPPLMEELRDALRFVDAPAAPSPIEPTPTCECGHAYAHHAPTGSACRAWDGQPCDCSSYRPDAHIAAAPTGGEDIGPLTKGELQAMLDYADRSDAATAQAIRALVGEVLRLTATARTGTQGG